MANKLAEPDGANSVYEKLFYGNNVAAVTPLGASYVPEWSDDEVAVLVSVFQAGLQALYEVLDVRG